MTIFSFFVNRETHQGENKYSGYCRQSVDGNFEARIGEKDEIDADDAKSEGKNKFFQGAECPAFSEDGQKQKTAREKHD